MKLRKILSLIIASAFMCWVGIFLFVQYKTDSFIKKFAPNEVQVSYEHLYVLPGYPLTIIVQNIKAVADGVVFNADMYIYPRFSTMIMEMKMSVDHRNDEFSVPIVVTTKKSANKNFYLDKFRVNHASMNIEGSKIEVDGGIEFYQHKMPLGGYDISMSDTQKLLESDLLSKYPKILYKLRKILGRMGDKSQKFRLDYTETGMKLDGVPVENL